jgi:hypothetical protein
VLLVIIQEQGLLINGGTLIMRNSSIISNNTVSWGNGSRGGGVFMTHGEIIMEDNASITDNKADFGGGIYICEGNITMKGSATILGNIAKNGGGLYVNMLIGHLKINLQLVGELFKKTKPNLEQEFILQRILEGLFLLEVGFFVISGGEIIENEAEFVGGGVYIEKDNTFTKSGGNISKNTAGDSEGENVFQQKMRLLQYVWVIILRF